MCIVFSRLRDRQSYTNGLGLVKLLVIKISHVQISQAIALAIYLITRRSFRWGRRWLLMILHTCHNVSLSGLAHNPPSLSMPGFAVRSGVPQAGEVGCQTPCHLLIRFSWMVVHKRSSAKLKPLSPRGTDRRAHEVTATWLLYIRRSPVLAVF